MLHSILVLLVLDCDGAVVYKDCSSHGHVFEECSVSGVKTITNVWVHEKYSSSSCIYHSGDPPAQSNSKLPGKFGFTATTIWVNSGCRAKFAVTDAGEYYMYWSEVIIFSCSTQHQDISRKSGFFSGSDKHRILFLPAHKV